MLADYVIEHGFTHVEFLPLKEHPYGPSWGYQVSALLRASARYGTPDDLRYLVDYLHQSGHWRDHGLGAGAFSQRRVCARPFRWLGALRTSRSA